MMSQKIKSFQTQTHFEAPAVTTALYRSFPKFTGYWKILQILARFMPRNMTVFPARISIDAREFRIPVDARDPYQISVFAEHKDELCVPAAMALLLAEGDAYLDVGANAGWYCRFMFQIVGDTGLIVALEPNDRAFQYLRKLVHPNFVFLPFAATANNGQQLHDTSNALHQAASTKFMQSNVAANYGSGETFAPGRSLDHLFSEFRRHPTVIKIDVEGAELHVLRGGPKTLEHAQGVMIEVNDDATCAQFGYRFSDIYDLMEKAGFAHRYEARNRDNTLYKLDADERLCSDIFFTRQELKI